jgi:hypothetical protein
MSAGSREHWLAIWDEYPHRAEFEGIPRGFVIEADGSIVGSISSVWAKYSLAGRELRATLAGNAAVDPSHRASSIRLFGEQLLQPNVDLYLNGSASEATSKVMETLKVRRVPQPSNDVCLLWGSGTRFARAGLERKGVPLARVAAWPVGLALGMGSSFKIRRAGGTPYPVIETDAFSEEFDDLWRIVRGRATQLIGFRDSATLHWRYSREIAAGNATILTVRRDAKLAGYVTLVRRPRPALGVTGYCIHDFQCVDDDPELVSSLLAAAWRQTRKASIDLLEWSGFAGQKRAIAERSCLLTFSLDVWQAFYYTKDRGLKAELDSPARWEFSSYDSD